jgi:hypothetical protein
MGFWLSEKGTISQCFSVNPYLPALYQGFAVGYALAAVIVMVVIMVVAGEIDIFITETFCQRLEHCSCIAKAEIGWSVRW